MRYTEAQQQKILAKINAAAPGKYMDAVKKSGVNYATISRWRKGTKYKVDKRMPYTKLTPKDGISKGVVKELFDLRNRLNKIIQKL